jgi:hypothetical protein
MIHSRGELRWSFCNRRESGAVKLIAGRNSYICDQWVDMLHNILACGEPSCRSARHVRVKTLPWLAREMQRVSPHIPPAKASSHLTKPDSHDLVKPRQ